jgi:hypothetical protein
MLLFCLACTACSGFFYVAYLEQTAAKSAGTIDLPPLTPNPHIRSTFSPATTIVFEDDFSDDHNGWIDASSWIGGGSTEEIKDGKLFFASASDGHYAITTCTLCDSLNQPYFLIADLTTGQATDQDFGIMFDKGDNPSDFYVFQVNTEKRYYYVSHHATNNWLLRTSGESNLIRSYPATNTLGIYVNKDNIEFYINGEIVDSYQETETSFQTGVIGFYVDNSSFELVIDNLLIYKIESQ